jgi:hypothetical protein
VSYRLYTVCPNGRLQLSRTLECADDEAALQQARAGVDGQAAELWHGGRLVGRFSKLGIFTSADSHTAP